MAQGPWYREAHDLFVNALRSAPDDAWVPGCPAWHVHDLLAHQVLQLEAASGGTFPTEDAISAIAAPTPGERLRALRRQERWIAAGVAESRGVSRGRLLTQWRDLIESADAQALEGLFPDLSVHLYDLLGSIGSTRHHHHGLIRAALEFWIPYATERIRHNTGHTMRVEVVDAIDGRSAQGSDVDGDVVVTATAFELLRAVTGRRARSQAGALVWSALDDRIIAAFPVYGWRDAALYE